MTWLLENWQTVAGGLSALLVTIVGGSEAKKRGWLNWLPFMAQKAAPVASAEDEIDTAAAELLRVAKIARAQGRDAVLNHTVSALTELMRPVKGESK
ncbi:hypothetical protein [Planctomyces sp. SH-PL14]|uniref:hypothetical protein n=1 Tax=Planctomyces sp. SH-PL14 TaxID=1632864 RepID=UPI00078E2C3F|nr:hypothetical protein [Planctomyces sp. SH-PL14]AMV18243.1 hypothetical protein VT03_10165 [Planctomyces sp. SH-PL14]